MIKKKGLTMLHNSRFYNLAPRSIMCMSYNKSTGKLALSRSDATIEVWNMDDAPFLEKIVVEVDKGSVEGLGWSGNRLFSAGIYGRVVEWDLAELKVKQSQHATGNSIWCLDVNPASTQIAIGTEGGFLNIFDISNNEISNQRLFDKQEGRILCCKFDPTGETIVTGSIDVIRIWNVQAGHAIHKINVGRNFLKRPTIVWSLLVLTNSTIISGDSRGQVTIWDGKMGTLIETHHVLKADVLTLSVNDEEDTFICSGIDPIIRIFAKAEIKKQAEVHTKWVKFLQRNVHNHDVKSLICADGKIFSGGMDGFLGVSSYIKHETLITKIGPFLQKPCATVSVDARLVLLRYPRYLEIWRLGTAHEKELSATYYKVKSGPEKLLELLCKKNEMIVCSSMSQDALWLIYSTATKLRIFNFTPYNEALCRSTIERVKYHHELFTSCLKIMFSNDSKTFFIVKINKDIEVFSIQPNGDIDHKQTINAGKYMKDTIHIIQISKSGKYLVTAGLCRTIAVWVREKSEFKHHINLPHYFSQTTALALHADKPYLVVAFADSKIYEYDMEEMCFTCSDKYNYVPDLDTHYINGILVDPRIPGIFVCQNDKCIFVLQKTKDQIDSSLCKKPHLETRDCNEKIDKLKVKFSRTYEHCLHIDWVAENELVIVELHSSTLTSQMPAALRQKKFGAV